MSSDSFKKLLPTKTSFTNHIYLINAHKQDLALKNLQDLICHKTQPANNYYYTTIY